MSYTAAFDGLALATQVPRLGRSIAINVVIFVVITTGWPLLFQIRHLATASVLAGDEMGSYGLGNRLAQLRDDGDQSLLRADGHSRMLLAVRCWHSVEMLASHSGVVHAGVGGRRGEVLGRDEDFRPLPGADAGDKLMGLESDRILKQQFSSLPQFEGFRLASESGDEVNSTLSRSIKGPTAPVNPRCLALTNVPRTPIGSSPSCLAIARPAASSIRIAEVLSSKARANASDSPGSSVAMSFRTWSRFPGVWISTKTSFRTLTCGSPTGGCSSSVSTAGGTTI